MLASDEDELQLVRAITEETREDKAFDLQVLVLRPCNPAAQAGQEEILMAPVKVGGSVKPRMLIVDRVTETCDISMKPSRVKKAAKTPTPAETVVMRSSAARACLELQQERVQIHCHHGGCCMLTKS